MPIIGTIASSYLKSTTAYESIATTTISGTDQTDIVFSSIPSTFSHLQLRMVLRTSENNGQQNFRLKFNGDTGSNYAWQRMYSNGTSATSDYAANEPYILLDRTAANNASANLFGACIVDILDYKTDKYKMTRSLGGVDLNGSGFIMFEGGAWFNTSAITSITVSASANQFTTNSKIALYGIRAG